MPSSLRQLHVPLTEEQHAALEAYAQECGLSKTEAVRAILAEKVAGFAEQPVPKRGKYKREKK